MPTFPVTFLTKFILGSAGLHKRKHAIPRRTGISKNSEQLRASDPALVRPSESLEPKPSSQRPALLFLPCAIIACSLIVEFKDDIDDSTAPCLPSQSARQWFRHHICGHNH